MTLIKPSYRNTKTEQYHIQPAIDIRTIKHLVELKEDPFQPNTNFYYLYHFIQYEKQQLQPYHITTTKIAEIIMRSKAAQMTLNQLTEEAENLHHILKGTYQQKIPQKKNNYKKYYSKQKKNRITKNR